MKKFILNFFVLSSFISSSCSNTLPDVLESYNTIITIHYKNESDKNFAVLQKYDDFRLNDYGIVSVPNCIIENQKLTTTIKLNIHTPCLLLLGFDELYIEPNNTLDIDYKVVKHTKTEFVNSIRINHGIGIILKNDDRGFLSTIFNNRLKNISNISEIKDVFSEANLTTAANKYIKNNYYGYFNLKHSIQYFLQQYYIQKSFVQLMIASGKMIPEMTDSLKLDVRMQIKKLSESLSRNLQIKTWSYWFGMGKVYEMILDKEFKKVAYSHHAIQPVINNYDSTAQQYFFLLSVKTHSTAFSNIGSGIDSIKNNLTQLLQQVSYEPFKQYIEKLKVGNFNVGFINENINNCMVYDYRLQKNFFKKIFTTASQKYILFDFCGSWCKPCLEEIKQYKVSNKLDTSSIIKPIWIFFENNKTDWLAVINKYGLKKENCFLVEDNDKFTKLFSISFSWQGEFPHHFLFDNQGNILNNKAESLSAFEITQLTK